MCTHTRTSSMKRGGPHAVDKAGIHVHLHTLMCIDESICSMKTGGPYAVDNASIHTNLHIHMCTYTYTNAV